MWDDYSQLGAARLVVSLPSHIQRALVESFLNILGTKEDEWSNLQVFHQRHFLLLFLFHLLILIHPEGLFLLEGQQHPEKNIKYRMKTIYDDKLIETRPLDSRTRMTTSTRFELKFFRVFSKYRLPGKLHFNIFHQKS